MIDMNKIWSFIFSICGRLLPPVAYFFLLVNQYLWQGEDKNEFYKAAPFKRFFKKICIPIFSSYVLFIGGGYYIKNFDFALSEMIRVSYPSVLGFAIGLFALVVSSEKFEKIKSSSITKARHIAIDMAYPLYVIFSVLVANYLLSYEKSDDFPVFLAVVNVYSILLIYDMVAAVYMYAHKK